MWEDTDLVGEHRGDALSAWSLRGELWFPLGIYILYVHLMSPCEKRGWRSEEHSLSVLPKHLKKRLGFRAPCGCPPPGEQRSRTVPRRRGHMLAFSRGGQRRAPGSACTPSFLQARPAGRWTDVLSSLFHARKRSWSLSSRRLIIKLFLEKDTSNGFL